MTQKAVNNAKVLYRLNISRSDVEETHKIFTKAPFLLETLTNPVVSEEAKEVVLDKIARQSGMPELLENFMKMMCRIGEIGQITDIFNCYYEYWDKMNHILHAKVIYADDKAKEEKEAIQKQLESIYPDEKVVLSEETDASLLGGYVVRVGYEEYDHSYEGKLRRLERKINREVNLVGAISAEDIISIIQSEIENFDVDNTSEETGTVIYVGDGIVTVYGIDHAMYGEVVVFDNGVKGMVQDIRQNEIGVILFGRDTGIKEGTKVVRTKKKAGIPVGNEYIGRVINAIGEPIDGGAEIKADGYRPIEEEAPGIIERKSVDTPMETGILSIDSMFPIGRGQRELIIGDRQTGKTSIATDTILNQKGKGVICIYVAIGQKASSVAKIVNTLEKYDAMDYSIVLSSTASEPASLQYIAPYAGTALAEYFMHQGKDVLIVYDDLSKHAVAYRAISLLLERSPGREAYPGDVFYLHSRLLERSSRLSDKLGGGSITALPIIETQAGDVSAYIPTNVISITDGQIFLESNLFFEGMRPAVNVGLSVSRVGGAAQTKAMKKACGSIRIDLAQYREMEVFTQFSSDLDDATKAQLAHGRAIMELLKQPLCHPLSLHEQVITLCLANNGIFDIVMPKEVKKYQKDILSYLDLKHPEIGKEIEKKKDLTDELIAKIIEAAKEYTDK